MDVTNSQVEMLARLLDVAGLRHRAIAQNVANVNTPGYRQRDVLFEDAFARALTSSQQAALKVQPKLAEVAGGTERADGNNVDMDQEMGRLQKNALLYRVYAQLLAGELATMRSAISGR